MRTFTCPVCRHLVPFESTFCLTSQTALSFDWHACTMAALSDRGPCANRDLIGCNGAADAGGLCRSCALTRTRPADSDQAGLLQFAAAEGAKRRLLFSLLELGLPVDGYRDRSGGLAFDLLSSVAGPVTTGHADGVITLDLAEADDLHREQLRTRLGEPYRTLLGHMRHEVAHYFQPILVPEGSESLDRCRDLFGDDRADYSEAMDRHYDRGAPDGWQQQFVSAYASMHPWEDWAETFAHYLHIRDVLQTAVAYGVTVSGPQVLAADAAPLYAYPAAAPDDLRAILDTWLPLTYALNAINRSLGKDDLYPFVLPPPVVDKLVFIDGVVRTAGAAP